jgi:hypothetical protein
MLSNMALSPANRQEEATPIRAVIVDDPKACRTAMLGRTSHISSEIVPASLHHGFARCGAWSRGPASSRSSRSDVANVVKEGPTSDLRSRPH